MPCLKSVQPQGRPKIFPIYKKITSIGRAAGNDVVLERPSVAEYHCQIIFDGRDFNLNELDRDGELQINAKKKRRGKLEHNDRLLVGDVELVFSVYDESLGQSDSLGTDAEHGHGAELAGLHQLYEFSQRLMEIKDLHELLGALLDAVIEVTHAGKGFVILLDEAEPRVAVARNVAQQNIPDAVRQLSDSILAKVIETRRPLIVSDALNDSMFRGAESEIGRAHV